MEKRRLVVVPELYYWCAQFNFPCIPKPLYKDLVRELLPIGTARAKIFIKVVFMAIFVYYVVTIAGILGMDDDDDSLFDLTKVVVLFFAVSIPTLIGHFQSGKVKAIKVLHKKGIVREEIERFLSRNEAFYDYKKGLEQLRVSVEDEKIGLIGGCRCKCEQLEQALDDIKIRLAVDKAIKTSPDSSDVD